MSARDDAVAAIVAVLAPRLGERVAAGASIGPLTTYRLGGPAAVLVRVADVAAVVRAVRDRVAAATGTVLIPELHWLGPGGWDAPGDGAAA
jgi:UDP-N-acetylenolpyruvoylglucosamine reductase